MKENFNYFYSGDPTSIIGFRRCCHIGNSKDDCIKLDLHQKRYPWEHKERQILDSLINFSEADTYIDPICLNGYEWDDIKIAIIEQCLDYGDQIEDKTAETAKNG